MDPYWPDAGLYRQRKVLVTGGFGFLGLNLVASLSDGGAEVRVLDLAWPPPLGGQFQSVLDNVEYYKGDLRDDDITEEAVRGCQIVFNLAGRSGAVASNESPLDDLDINARGQLMFLESCRRVSPDVKIVFASSRLVYKPAESLPVPETAALEPLSIYGIHKLAGECYHLLYTHLYGMRSTILRITNPYGPFQRREQSRYGIINWFIQLAIKGQPLPVYGDGLQLRDYVHVYDVVRAFLISGLDVRTDGRIFNVGGGQAVSFIDMANTVIRFANAGHVQFVEWPKDATRTETGSFVGDISLLRNVTGWYPRISVEEGLAHVVHECTKMERNSLR